MVGSVDVIIHISAYNLMIYLGLLLMTQTNILSHIHSVQAVSLTMMVN